MMWNVEIEPLTQYLRLYKPGATYGDPYEWGITIRHFTPKHIELVGMATNPTKKDSDAFRLTPSIWRDIRSKFQSMGIETVRWKRIVAGVEKEHVFDLTK